MIRPAWRAGILAACLSVLAVAAAAQAKPGLALFDARLAGIGSDSASVDVDALFELAAPAFRAAFLSALNERGDHSIRSFTDSPAVDRLPDLGKRLWSDGAGEPALDALDEEARAFLRGVRVALVPVVERWSLEYTPETGYAAQASGTLWLYGPGPAAAPLRFKAEGRGSDPSEPLQAAAAALESLGAAWREAVAASWLFRRQAVIAELLAGRIIVDCGSQAGFMAGDEFDVVAADTDGGPGTVVGRIALVDVRGEWSFAREIWSSRRLAVGDFVREVPPQPFLGSVGVGALVQLVEPVAFAGVASSFRISFHRGLPVIRPMIDLGLSFLLTPAYFTVAGFPVGIMAGAELPLEIGALSVAPGTMVGLVFLVPLAEGESWALAGVRGQVAIRVSARIDNALELYVEPGWAVQFSGGSLNGLWVAAGVTFR